MSTSRYANAYRRGKTPIWMTVTTVLLTCITLFTWCFWLATAPGPKVEEIEYDPIGMDLDTFKTRFNAYTGLRDVGSLVNEELGWKDGYYCAAYTVGHGMVLVIQLCDDSDEHIVHNITLYGWVDTEYNQNQFWQAILATNKALTGDEHMSFSYDVLSDVIDNRTLIDGMQFDDIHVTIMNGTYASDDEYEDVYVLRYNHALDE